MFVADEYTTAALLRRRERDPVNRTPDGKQLPHQAAHAPRIFADTADYDAIKKLFEAGIINGVTTNPTHLKKAGAHSWDEAKNQMRAICQLLHPHPVSLELTEIAPEAMIKQAEELHALRDNSVIKVATGGDQQIDRSLDPFTGLKVMRALWERDIPVNATLIFNSTQAFWAALCGAVYVSPFLGRIADYLYKHDHPERPDGNSLYWIEDHKNSRDDQRVANTEYVASGGKRKDAGMRLVREVVQIFSIYDIQSEVLAASFRNFAQISEALLAGADILTVPSELLMRVADHPLTDEGMSTFVADSGAFGEPNLVGARR
jgi:transaldolase